MTEEEAKTKLCVHQPFARTALATTGEAVQTYCEPRCVGSACMAWRLYGSTKSEQDAGLGWCGLAGKP